VRRIVMYGLYGSTYFPHYPPNGVTLGRKLLNIKSTKNVYFRKNSSICYYKCAWDFMDNIRYCCEILMELEFSQRTLEKYSNMKFHENPSSGSRVVPHGQTDMTSNNELYITFYFMCVLFSVS
jgi:hypothetical protein